VQAGSLFGHAGDANQTALGKEPKP